MQLAGCGVVGKLTRNWVASTPAHQRPKNKLNMTIAYFCIVIAIFIPLACTAYAKIKGKGYNNRRPREFAETLVGRAKRAHDASQNSFENFAPFAVGVVVAHQLHATQATVDALAIGFIIARILYAIFYINDQHAMRTVVWFIGLFITITLYFVRA